MKQLLQSFKTGQTFQEEVPLPSVSTNKVLIKTTYSLVSLGTERMLVEFGKASLLEKARKQPEKVKMVLDKVKTDGLSNTIHAVKNKLDQPIPLGYCNVGTVLKPGSTVADLQIGDRVVSNGPHAEAVSVSKNLVAKIPHNVSDEEAAFTVIGSIALQGVRLTQPTLGEIVVVQGLGLIGLITCQLLIANGCQVIGIDPDPDKCSIAQGFGVSVINPSQTDPVKSVMDSTKIGADAILICASTNSNELIAQAAQMSRKRGRIVLVGVVGLNINRADFYQKELTFQVSCSYGPGRYDTQYEDNGVDYPPGFVRWTEQRNFEAFLQLLSDKKIDVNPLISRRVKFEYYKSVYDNIGITNDIATIFEYNQDDTFDSQTVHSKSSTFQSSDGNIAIIGAGNFTGATMLPALKKLNAPVKLISSSAGTNGSILANKFNIPESTTLLDDIWNDSSVDLVMITTRHNSHASLVKEALNNGKHVFVEKPLALNDEELEDIKAAVENSKTSLTVGFNRRFSPHVIKMKELLGEQPGEMNITATMNAGFIPLDHWTQDLEIGGGRIIGEACHFIDLMIYLTNSEVVSVCMNGIGERVRDSDNASILLKFANGSNGVINYFANGSKKYQKERLEVYYQNKTLILDNFRKLSAYGFKSFSKMKTKLDKGHQKQFELLLENKKLGGRPLIPFHELYNSSLSSIKAVDSLVNNSWMTVEKSY